MKFCHHEMHHSCHHKAESKTELSSQVSFMQLIACGFSSWTRNSPNLERSPFALNIVILLPVAAAEDEAKVCNNPNWSFQFKFKRSRAIISKSWTTKRFQHTSKFHATHFERSLASNWLLKWQVIPQISGLRENFCLCRVITFFSQVLTFTRGRENL